MEEMYPYKPLLQKSALTRRAEGADNLAFLGVQNL